MKIRSIDYYKDGGTMVATCEDGTQYYVDRRIGTTTPDAIYTAYPHNGDVPLAGDNSLIAALIEAAWRYKNAYKDERAKERCRLLDENQDFEAYKAHRKEDLK
jgi:hypothetical protein